MARLAADHAAALIGLMSPLHHNKPKNVPIERHEMKRTPWKSITALVAVAGIAVLALAGCSGSSQTGASTQPANEPAQKSQQAVRYTCSMHPEVVQDKPGNCPKCGMKLVEKH